MKRASACLPLVMAILLSEQSPLNGQTIPSILRPGKPQRTAEQAPPVPTVMRPAECEVVAGNLVIAVQVPPQVPARPVPAMPDVIPRIPGRPSTAPAEPGVSKPPAARVAPKDRNPAKVVSQTKLDVWDGKPMPASNQRVYVPGPVDVDWERKPLPWWLQAISTAPNAVPGKFRWQLSRTPFADFAPWQPIRGYGDTGLANGVHFFIALDGYAPRPPDWPVSASVQPVPTVAQPGGGSKKVSVALQPVKDPKAWMELLPTTEEYLKAVPPMGSSGGTAGGLAPDPDKKLVDTKTAQAEAALQSWRTAYLTGVVNLQAALKLPPFVYKVAYETSCFANKQGCLVQ